MSASTYAAASLSIAAGVSGPVSSAKRFIVRSSPNAGLKSKTGGRAFRPGAGCVANAQDVGEIQHARIDVVPGSSRTGSGMVIQQAVGRAVRRRNLNAFFSHDHA